MELPSMLPGSVSDTATSIDNKLETLCIIQTQALLEELKKHNVSQLLFDI